ncbi:MAG: disulfide bond formation protein B [Nitriliruptoraceae bacterium]
MIAIAERTFGLLALLAIVIAVGTAVALLTRRVPTWLKDEVALPLALAIATVTTFGSLLLSEVAGYPPCELCWYQRIAMYPLVVVLGVAIARRDREVWRTVLPLAGLGGAVSIWHILLERNPGWGGPCDEAAPCTVLWVQEFGFLTLPTMALIAFVSISLLSYVARRPS